jgi:hypothetical protein
MPAARLVEPLIPELHREHYSDGDFVSRPHGIGWGEERETSHL